MLEARPRPSQGIGSQPASPVRPVKITVAIFNTNDDLVELLRAAIEKAGFVAVTGHIDDARRGTLLLSAFVSEHDPKVIVYDIAPPYEQHWHFFQHVREQPYMQGRQFVLTSTNVERARETAGIDEPIYEIVGKPYDIDQLISAIKEASRARSIR
jgi:DNA-binding NarL/FixJ family response regulator